VHRLLFLLSACGRIGFDPGGQQLGIDAPIDVVAPVAQCNDMPSQTFDTIPSSYTEYGGSPGTMIEADGTLHLTFPGGGFPDGQIGLETPLVSFRDHAARIRLAKTFPPTVDAMVQVGLHGRDERGLHFELSGGTLFIRSNDGNGTMVEANEPANTAEVWWQFREAGGSVFCEVSTDAISWRVVYATPPAFFDIDDVFIDMGGTTNSGLPTTDDIRFDDFTTECP
jgi:hypothetical protein